MPEPSILLVEDDPAIRETTALALGRMGFAVATAADGAIGLELFRSGDPGVAIVDLMLPVLDGVSLCRMIRAESEIPVIVVSARSDPVDIVLGLEAGADDYITKPFDAAVLAARVRAVLRRARRFDDRTGPVVVSDLEVDEAAMTVRLAGRAIPVTRTELRLLAELGRNAGIVLSRNHLLSRVWDYEWNGDTRLVDVHVQRVRAKIGADRIETVRGVGYRMRR
jgi:two-component system response regulator MtrA